MNIKDREKRASTSSFFYAEAACIGAQWLQINDDRVLEKRNVFNEWFRICFNE